MKHIITLTKTARQCNNCFYKDECNHKLMEMVSAITIEQSARETMQPILREDKGVRVYKPKPKGGIQDASITIDLNLIEKQLNERIFKGSGLMFGA